jgi:DNA polymerase I
MAKKFVIIDAMALSYKAYFAFISRPLSTSKGEPVSAVYGFINQLIRILETQKPDYIAVAFDSKEKTFRHERYDGYKSSRQKMPEDMIPQIQRIKDLIDILNMPVYILPRFEADDIIGTAVRRAEAEGIESSIITPDKDCSQLITKKVKVVKAGKATDEIITIDEESFKKEFGFEPILMIDYLALVGDSSDDIPGVAGIGPKSATPLIQQFGSVENIYAHIDEVEKKGIRQKLIDNKELAFLSKELATIHLNVPLEFDFEKAKFEKPDFEKLKNFCLELEFSAPYIRFMKLYNSLDGALPESTDSAEETPIIPTTVEEISAHEPAVYESSKVDYHLVKDFKAAQQLAKELENCELFVFDTETDSLDQFTLNLAGVSFCIKPGTAYFVAVDPETKKHDLFSTETEDRLPSKDFVSLFSGIFKNDKIKKVCQNGKFDIGVLRGIGIEVNNFYFDTMLASYVVDPDQKHGMDDLAQKYLSYRPIPLSDLIGAKKDASKIFEVDAKILSDYSCEDADITYKLFDVLSAEIKNLELEHLCYDIEFPLARVLEDMERTGVSIDRLMLNTLSKELSGKLDSYSKKIFELAGMEFNINSPLQLQKVLFDKLNLNTGKKTKTGFSTDAKSLDNLRGEHPIIDEILDYRQVSKLKSTYADALPNLINPITGRVHTSFNQTVTSTGRLSSNNPNLQNIPIRTEMGKEIRKAFTPRDKDHLILSADYSQIELRIMASLCNDEALQKAFKNNEDIHRSTAALVFMVPLEEVTPEMRRKAKEVNFGILYGIGPFGLKSRLGITQNHAKEIIDTYFNTFKNVRKFIDDSIEIAGEHGYAQTVTGRRRYLKNIKNSNRVVRQFEERVAVNMPIQGTAADMIKIAMIRVFDALKKNKFKSKMVLQVHDELVFDANKSELNELVPLVKELMENALPLNVPVIAETGIGDNWLDAH